ncbi:MAG: transglutaminase-like domain-containing protein [Gammaproteobacteria bacterium]|nr:transglutaminase-like domain-containing protein [Gammaproteobacteria bacterium]MDH3374895.1 transglutaminase-like domain-containing protein [Gammaproteobacteria bacterium]MDH3409966.1 transglutaminase-like domain-containing protein [Gammaproteobacteria bacterium]
MIDFDNCLRYRMRLVFGVLLIAACSSGTLPDENLSEQDPTITVESIAKASIIDDQSSTEKVRAVVDWTHGYLDWTDNDYVERTVNQVLQRGGGTCYEQAVVVEAVLKHAGVNTRQVREINIQPASEQRQRDAEALMADGGDAFSVFGRRHNDHVWIEYWNEETSEWTPADPTLNLIGYDEWVRARMGYEGRPVHEIIPSRDMLVPIAVFAVDQDAKAQLKNRTERYLIDGFAGYMPAVVRQPEWTQWTNSVTEFAEHAHAAFAGEYNLHQDTASIDRLAEVYEALDPLKKR